MHNGKRPINDTKKNEKRKSPPLASKIINSDDSEDEDQPVKQLKVVRLQDCPRIKKEDDASVRRSTSSELGEIGIVVDVDDDTEMDDALQAAFKGNDDVPEAEDDVPEAEEQEEQEEEEEEQEEEQEEAEEQEEEEEEEEEDDEELSATQAKVAQIRAKWANLSRTSAKDHKSKAIAVRKVVCSDTLLHKLEGNSAHAKLLAYVGKKKPDKKERWVRTTADMLFLMLATKTKKYKSLSSLRRYLDTTNSSVAMTHICLKVLNKKAESETVVDLVKSFHETVAQIVAK